MDGLSQLADWANQNEGLLQALAMLGGIAALFISLLRQRSERARARDPVPAKLILRSVPAVDQDNLISVLGGYGGQARRDGDTVIARFSDADDAARAALEAQASLPEQLVSAAEILICERDAPIPDADDGNRGEVRTSVVIHQALLDASDLQVVREGVGAVPFVVTAASPGVRLRRWALPAVGVVLVVAAAGWLVGGLGESGPLSGSASPRKAGFSLSDAPSIAILPFANLSKDPEREYFADGVTEDMISTLGRFADLVVMSWNAVRPYKEAPAVARQVGEDLNVRYVVDGSIRRQGDRVRVSAELTETETGALLWSKRYDRPIDHLFAVQDEIVQGIVGALALEVSARELKRAFAKPPDSLSAYDYVLRGRKDLQELTRSGNLEARKMFEKAIELDSQYSAAYAGLGWTHDFDVAYGWTAQPNRALETAHELVREAIRLQPSNASAYTLLSQIHVHRQRFDLSTAAIDQAIAINPSAAESHAHRIWVMIASGRPDEAIASGETALRFDPNSPPLVFGNLGWAYYLERRYELAVATLERALTKNSNYAFAQIGLVVTYAETERADEAARAVDAARRVSPFFDLEAFCELFQASSDRERIAAALRKAGLE